MTKRRGPIQRNWLLFVDTNIFLDFYRARNELGLSLLDRLRGVQEKIICTYQIEMEFKKNRQAAILETLSSFKGPSTYPQPAILDEDKRGKAANRKLKEVEKHLSTLRNRLINVLANPAKYDRVYKTFQGIFSSAHSHNLTRDSEEKYLIRRRAMRRFILGYPPRKDRDLAIGDAINWEWIIRCAAEGATRSDVIIVSRDSDYGATVAKESYINDWLFQEFRNRVSKQRQIKLVPRLSLALQQLAVTVPEKEAEAENQLIAEARGTSYGLPPEMLARLNSGEAAQKTEAMDALEEFILSLRASLRAMAEKRSDQEKGQ